jgi:hypothetical protein
MRKLTKTRNMYACMMYVCMYDMSTHTHTYIYYTGSDKDGDDHKDKKHEKKKKVHGCEDGHEVHVYGIKLLGREVPACRFVRM